MLKLDRQERYRQRYKQIRAGYRPALEIYQEISDQLVTPQTRLLDAGCGEGGLSQHYQTIAPLVIGIDRYVQPIRETIGLHRIVDGDLQRLPFSDQTFTMVMCSWVLEHLENPQQTFSEIRRVLRPNGYFLFITPNAYNYLIMARRLIPNRVSTPVVDRLYGRGEDFIFPTFYRANTQAAINRYLQPLGFVQRRFEYVSDPTYTAFNDVLFYLTIGVEGVLNTVFPQGKVHLVGLYQLEETKK